MTVVIIINMAIQNGRGGIIITVLLYFSTAHCSVFWYMSTKRAVFGQDTILTCNTGHLLLNSKDCPVRQWSGGPDRNGLMYNGYSSNEEKYEEEANLTTSQFSLKIKNFSESDVNVNYTCSCGFDTFTQKLALNNTHFHYLPTAFNITVDSKDHSVKVKIECNKIYPLPTCSFNIGNRLVFEDELSASKKNGLFYSLKFENEFALSADDCNKIPVIKCEFCKESPELKLIEYSGKQTQECAETQTQSTLYEDVTIFDVESTNETSNMNTTLVIIAIITAVSGLVVVTGIIIIIYRALQKRKRNVLSSKKGEQEASDILIESNINSNEICIKQHIICYQPDLTM